MGGPKTTKSITYHDVKPATTVPRLIATSSTLVRFYPRIEVSKTEGIWINSQCYRGKTNESFQCTIDAGKYLRGNAVTRQTFLRVSAQCITVSFSPSLAVFYGIAELRYTIKSCYTKSLLPIENFEGLYLAE